MCLASNKSIRIAEPERNAIRDRRVRRALQRLGYRVLVVWECQTAIKKRDRLAVRITRFLEA